MDDGHGGRHMGLLTQIAAEPSIRVCGDGFNDRTVMVKSAGAFYYVFRRDLEDVFGEAGKIPHADKFGLKG
jgi:hypothetical protein